jgi:hypothetical protein
MVQVGNCYPNSCYMSSLVTILSERLCELLWGCFSFASFRHADHVQHNLLHYRCLIVAWARLLNDVKVQQGSIIDRQGNASRSSKYLIHAD